MIDANEDRELEGYVICNELSLLCDMLWLEEKSGFEVEIILRLSVRSFDLKRNANAQYWN